MLDRSISIGRNDLCPCASGRKYKRCCLDADAARQRAARAENVVAPNLFMEAIQQALRIGRFRSDAELTRALHSFEALCESGTVSGLSFDERAFGRVMNEASARSDPQDAATLQAFCLSKLRSEERRVGKEGKTT